MATPNQPTAAQTQAVIDDLVARLNAAVDTTTSSGVVSTRSSSVTKAVLATVSASLTAALVLVPLIRSTVGLPGSCPTVIIPAGTAQTGG